VIWDRFPKFVLGFFGACLVISIISGLAPADHLGMAKVKGIFKSKAQNQSYDADFSTYSVPENLTDKFSFDPDQGVIQFRGKMSLEELNQLITQAKTSDQKGALKQLHYKSDWFQSELNAMAIKPIKKLRSWAFVFCFLCIGLSTRFKDLLIFGAKPFWAFTIGVLVNVPLGFILSTMIFSNYWQAIK